ncbi:MAG: HIT domain-containing protein [Gammaproteobacteria bacterium]|nr:HIT domain-containing protein [Gammaproteobacteria bacterium]
MTFILDPTLAKSSIEIAQWPLSTVLFKNEQSYAWFLLVPRRADTREIYQLDTADQQQLLAEITRLSLAVKQQFKPDKLNVAAIGNKIGQLHIHIVGRFIDDPLWPESIWQPGYQPKHYDADMLQTLIDQLQEILK